MLFWPRGRRFPGSLSMGKWTFALSCEAVVWRPHSLEVTVHGVHGTCSISVLEIPQFILFQPPQVAAGVGCSGEAQVSSGAAVRAVWVKGCFQAVKACFVLKKCSWNNGLQLFLQYQILDLFLNPWEIFCFSCLHLYGRWNQTLLILLMAHCSLGLREHFRVEILWLESLSPAETNPFSEAAVKTNFRAFLKCHFFSYCRNVSSAFILPFPESVPTHWFKEQQFQHLNSWLQEFPSITANPVLLLLGFFVCSNFLPTPDGWLEVLAGLWLSTKVICFSKGKEIPWRCWLSASERTNHRWECHKPTWNRKG